MRRLALVILIMCAAGCAVGPNYHRPDVRPPANFRSLEGVPSPESLADRPWWEIFGDDTLNELIDEALRNGYDARIAAWRVEEARARAGITRSQYFPQIDYSAAAARSRQSEYVAPLARGEAATSYQADVGLSWEIDVWGRIRRLNESARAEYLATEEARRGVMLSLVAEVASEYFQLCDLDRELDIARRTHIAFQETLDLFQRRLEQGVASGLETARAKASRDDVAAQIPEIERQIAALENQLSLLLGRPPGPVPRRPADGAAIPVSIPAGLPASLLERRPDVRQAEQTLISANANVGVAVASYFPKVSLTGMLGGVSPELSELLGKGKTWSVSAGLLGPIFQGGALKRQEEVAKAQWEEAKVAHERAVNNAFAEVATYLVANQKIAEAERWRAEEVAAYQEAVRLVNARYLAGLSSYFEVIDAMLELFPAEISLSQAQRERQVNFVQLYKALGGGWQPRESQTQPVTPEPTREPGTLNREP
ncbi:MAG: efflux transporter outer membrane subunit [Acidobacteriota bacterium]